MKSHKQLLEESQEELLREPQKKVLEVVIILVGTSVENPRGTP